MNLKYYEDEDNLIISLKILKNLLLKKLKINNSLNRIIDKSGGELYLYDDKITLY